MSALAVLPEYQNQGIAKILIAATLGHMVRSLGVQNSSLHVLGCDAGEKPHGLYTSCGYKGPQGAKNNGGTYQFRNVP